METAAEATTKTHPLRLRSVLIRRFRSVVPGTKLDFGPGPVFLLGRNGAGKTTLLELLARLISCDLAPFRKEEDPVDLEWVLEREDGGRVYFLALALKLEPVPPRNGHRPAPRWSFSGKANVVGGAEDAGSQLSFSYAWDREPMFEPSSRATEEPPLSPFDDSFMWYLYHDLAEPWPSIHAGRYTLELICQFPEVERFDESLGGFLKVVDSAEGCAEVISEPNQMRSYFIPDGLMLYLDDVWMDSSKDLHDERENRRTSVPSRFLNETNQILGAEKIELRPRLWEQDAKGKRTWRGFDLYVTWPGGVIHSHHQLSFGQKRIFAFLWYAFVYENAPLLTDELTNGLHASWVHRIVDLLQDKQAFHAVQNPLLVDMTGPGEEAEIPGRFVFCDVVRTDEGRQWRWRNPTPEEAHRLRAAFDAGFEGLSGILQSEGLW